jgi:hypothetical protein
MRRHDFTIKLADVRRSGLPPIFLRGSDKGAGEFVASSVCVTETRRAYVLRLELVWRESWWSQGELRQAESHEMVMR